VQVRLHEDELNFVLGRDNTYYILVIEPWSGQPVDIQKVASVRVFAKVPNTNIEIDADYLLFTKLANTVIKVMFPASRIPVDLKAGNVLYMYCDVTTTEGKRYSILQPPQRLRVVSPTT
jgi:hypothetical protein